MHATRYAYTNGSEHPEGPINWWMGDSRGHWDGDTLVVDVVHFSDQTWLDRTGNFHSDALHVVERYSLVDTDHINYEVTIEDPEVFTRPWTMRMTLYRRTEPNFQLLDYDCYAFEWEQFYRIRDVERGGGSVLMRLHQTTMALGMSVALLLLPASLFGQDAAPEPPAAPWPPAQTADGQPDIQGVWSPVGGGTQSLDPGMSSGQLFRDQVAGVTSNNPSRIVDPVDGHIPYQPWAAALQQELEAVYETPTRPEHIDSQTRCLGPACLACTTSRGFGFFNRPAASCSSGINTTRIG